MDFVETVIKAPLRYLLMLFIDSLRKIMGTKFTFDGKRYCYFHHMYNLAYKNERTVEIPIAYEMVRRYEGKRILEVGNVLAHYFPIDHEVVDKYEVAEGVINEDIMDFKPPHKYDLIVCISTLEHIGWDEEGERDPRKMLKTIKKFEDMLVAGGKAIVIFPVGYNKYLDELFNRGKINFRCTYYMKRVSWDNQWIEVNWEDIKNSKYGQPFTYANGLIIGIIEKT